MPRNPTYPPPAGGGKKLLTSPAKLSSATAWQTRVAQGSNRNPAAFPFLSAQTARRKEKDVGRRGAAGLGNRALRLHLRPTRHGGVEWSTQAGPAPRRQANEFNALAYANLQGVTCQPYSPCASAAMPFATGRRPIHGWNAGRRASCTAAASQWSMRKTVTQLARKERIHL